MMFSSSLFKCFYEQKELQRFAFEWVDSRSVIENKSTKHCGMKLGMLMNILKYNFLKQRVCNQQEHLNRK